MNRPFDPRLYLVTDPGLRTGATLVEAVAAAVAGGVTLVQLRDKAAETRSLVALARRLQALLWPLGVPLLVNDRIDVALAAGAAGVHLGQSDLSVEIARRLLGPVAIIGLSIERPAEIDAVPPGSVDYVAASPVFATGTKADTAAPLGLEGVAALRRRTALPIVAIGGITTERIADVVTAGADGIAVVSAILAAPEPAAAARTLRSSLDAALAARFGG